MLFTNVLARTVKIYIKYDDKGKSKKRESAMSREEMIEKGNATEKSRRKSRIPIILFQCFMVFVKLRYLKKCWFPGKRKLMASSAEALKVADSTRS